MTADDSFKDELIRLFTDRYLPRDEIIHRLPLSLPIGVFWPELVSERKKLAVELPLYDRNGFPFWFVINRTVENQCNAVSEMARRDYVFDDPVFETAADDAVLDEAVYSSVIEGAFTSRKEAAVFIREGAEPKNKSEQMVKNNYDALTYVLEHIGEPVTEETVIRIAEIVTHGTAVSPVTGYRNIQVYVSGPEGPVYTPPDASKVPDMMSGLIDFIRNSELHPVLKACIAHFYFVYVHPFEDGNGRTARALSYMMLLQSGYDFFRYFSVSDITAKERGRYYRSIQNSENEDGDITYFIDCYSGILARSVRHMEEHLLHHVFAERRLKQLDAAGVLNERQMKGAKWILESGQQKVTVEAWKKRYKVVTETARLDLLALCGCGLLSRTVEGRKAVFRISDEHTKA